MIIITAFIKFLVITYFSFTHYGASAFSTNFGISSSPNSFKTSTRRNQPFSKMVIPVIHKMSVNDEGDSKKLNLPMLLDPGTKGGALFLSLVLFILPIGGYEYVTAVLGVDGIEAGRWIGVSFTVLTCFLWVGTYIFRVATKDMTYARQLKDYENAVIAKRFEELDDDEIQALVEDIERDDF